MVFKIEKAIVRPEKTTDLPDDVIIIDDSIPDGKVLALSRMDVHTSMTYDISRSLCPNTMDWQWACNSDNYDRLMEVLKISRAAGY